MISLSNRHYINFRRFSENCKFSTVASSSAKCAYLKVNMDAKEDLMKKVGTFGLFQKRTLWVAYLMSILTGPTVMLCNVFMVYTPAHRCYIPSIDDNENFTHLQTTLPDITE